MDCLIEYGMYRSSIKEAKALMEHYKGANNTLDKYVEEMDSFGYQPFTIRKHWCLHYVIRIICIAILLACRKYLFYERDFEEEI